MTLGLKTAWRSWAHRNVRRAWQRRGLLAAILYPVHLLHGCWRGLRALAYGMGLVRPVRLPVPVLVVGNLTVGGTGKTPLVTEVVRALRARGWHPGIVCGGYGGRASAPLLVDATSDPAQCGDEPLLLRYVTDAPVAVGRDRVGAARLLLATHTNCDVLVADDGLQHRRLGRDMELVLLNALGTGNGLLLPAGPLRDPPDRLRSVDAVVLNGIVPPVRIHSPFFRMQTRVHEAVCMAVPARRIALADLAQEQRAHGLRVLALCAIGTPERFFAMLRAQGLDIEEIALPDHDTIHASMLPAGRYDRVLMTEKDAVKCYRDVALRSDERIWVVPLIAHVDAQLGDFVSSRLKESLGGSKVA